MSAAKAAVTVAYVTDEELGIGARIRARRTRLGVTVKGLAERAGVDRGRLTMIEDGAAARDSTIGAIERTLDELEQEKNLEAADLPPGVSPIGDPADGLMAVEVYTDLGVLRAIVKGPVKDADAIRKAAAELIAGANRSHTEDDA